MAGARAGVGQADLGATGGSHQAIRGGHVQSTAQALEQAQIARVEQMMRRLALGGRIDIAGDMAAQQLASGGKRLRARLALRSARLLGASEPDAVAWAAAVELLHNASLVHDDVQDGDRLRRGRPTVWATHGAAQAINAGDLLLTLAFRALGGVGLKSRAALCDALAYHVVETVRGQATELELVKRRRLTWDAYLEAVRGKTGALFGLPVHGAALLGGYSSELAARFGEAFCPVGTLFQLQDDLLDLYGDKGRGRAGNDIYEGKVSAPVVFHLERCPEDRDWLVRLLQRPRDRTDPQEVAAAIARFWQSGAVDDVLDEIEQRAAAIREERVLAGKPALGALAEEIVDLALRPMGALRSEGGDPMSSTPVVVIGAGFGGLAAAVRLRAMGHRVLVLEAGDQLGGRARVFRRDGFVFDAGPTVITAPYLLHELFSLVGRDSRDYFELLPVDPFYRVSFADGTYFDYVGDEARLMAEIERLSPQDVDGYRRMVGLCRRIFDVGYSQLAHVPFLKPMDMVRIVPQLVRLSSYRSVYGLVSSFIKDDRLRQAFSFQPLLIGGNPFRAPGIYLLIHWLERKWGVHFARGGTASIVGALGRLLNEIGVEVRLSSPVGHIETDNGRVRGVILEDGRRIAAEAVVCNADPTVVYSKMIDPAVLIRNRPAAVRRKRQSVSLFVAYFGTNRQYPHLKHHTILFGPRYRGLIADIFEHRRLADDFSLYLHAPGRTDPSLAPPGCDGFYVLSPVPNQLSGIDWAARSESYLEAILASLESRGMPRLRQHVVTKFALDPRYFEEDLRSQSGAAFGIEPVLGQSAYLRYHNRSPDVGGLYFVGASTHPGAGVPGVLNSAKILEAVVPGPREAADQVVAERAARSTATDGRLASAARMLEQPPSLAEQLTPDAEAAWFDQGAAAGSDGARKAGRRPARQGAPL